MNITFVSSGLGTGGAEFALLRLAGALRRQRASVAVVSLLDDGQLGGQLRDDGIPVLALGLRLPRAWFGTRDAFAAFHALGAPNVVQGWMYHGNLAALCLAPRDTPVAWGVRQSLLGNRDKLGTRLVIRASAALSRRATAIVYNSAAARTQHEAAGFAAAESTVIPNGFDLDRFQFDEVARNGLRGTLGIADTSVVIGHIARLHPSKDHAGFLRGFARIAQTRPFVRAVLAGESVDASNAALGALIEQLGIRDRVSLLGRRTDIATLMSSFEVFCSSSSGMEGFPNVVAEAMSCEVPCVATDVGDARAVVAGCGEIVPPRDVDALANALGRIVDMPVASRRALGAAARSHIAERFAIDTVARRYLQLYEALAAAREAPACAA